MNFKVTLVLLWFLLKAFQGQSAQTYAPVTIAGEPGSCPSEDERETVRQIISTNVSNVIAKFVAARNRNITDHCGAGLWTQVAYLNMNDSAQQCPSTWREYNASGIRACGRLSRFTTGCDATFYKTGQRYKKVCGRVIGYQFYVPQGLVFSTLSINHPYVQGVSITHGSPRNHIWSLSAGVSKTFIRFPQTFIGYTAICPCVTENGHTGPSPPSFVGDNYYCESGYSGSQLSDQILYTDDQILYTDDPLWDGKNCEGTCCSNGKSPPWFTVDLPNSTSDSIEVRLCQPDTESDTPIKLLELYIQ